MKPDEGVWFAGVSQMIRQFDRMISAPSTFDALIPIAQQVNPCYPQKQVLDTLVNAEAGTRRVGEISSSEQNSNENAYSEQEVGSLSIDSRPEAMKLRPELQP